MENYYSALIFSNYLLGEIICFSNLNFLCDFIAWLNMGILKQIGQFKLMAMF